MGEKNGLWFLCVPCTVKAIVYLELIIYFYLLNSKTIG